MVFRNQVSSDWLALQEDKIRATSWQNQQNGIAPSEDSDQPGHLPNLIRVFAVRMKKAWVLGYPLNAQSFCWFCHEAACENWPDNLNQYCVHLLALPIAQPILRLSGVHPSVCKLFLVIASPKRPLAGFSRNMPELFPQWSSCAHPNTVPVCRQIRPVAANFDFHCYRISSETIEGLSLKPCIWIPLRV